MLKMSEAVPLLSCMPSRLFKSSIESSYNNLLEYNFFPVQISLRLQNFNW